MFGALAKSGISVILISQASSEHSICFVIESKYESLAQKVINKEFELEMMRHLIDPLEFDSDVTVIAAVGEGLHHRIGVAGQVFSSLGNAGINVKAIAQGSSELNISIVVKLSDCTKAMRVIHDIFYLKHQVVQVFLVGFGLVGKTLISQIATHFSQLKTQHHVEIKLVGLANSKKMIVDPNGLSFFNLDQILSQCERNTDLNQFVTEMIQLKTPNTVFVDCTANDHIVDHYLRILQASIHIVSANKKPFTAVPFSKYKEMKDMAQEKKIALLYETTVGAGLPTINTLKSLIRTGDTILKIEAVLSGTLNYIFNTFHGTKTFSQVLLEAQQKGYTEPDPRDDLNGADVARKLLILAREIGLQLEMKDVQVQNLIPEQFRSLSLDQFLQRCSELDSVYLQQQQTVHQNNQVLRYIASLDRGICSVKLEAVGSDHASYSLKGSENIIIYTTKRYPSNPMVVKGPGAGSEVTATGVFADVLSIFLH